MVGLPGGGPLVEGPPSSSPTSPCDQKRCTHAIDSILCSNLSQLSYAHGLSVLCFCHCVNNYACEDHL